jgi:serine/threonine-protein kinase HipA
LGASLSQPERAIENVYQKFTNGQGEVKSLIESSFLPDDWKERYQVIWNEKMKILIG